MVLFIILILSKFYYFYVFFIDVTFVPWFKNKFLICKQKVQNVNSKVLLVSLELLLRNILGH